MRTEMASQPAAPETVIIADSDVARAERLAQACEAQGLRARRALHGASALEQALAIQPAALVVEIDLPLIDGPRLAEILRANPRTAPIAMLFIGNEETPQQGAHAGGRMLPGGADPETIARFVHGILEKRRAERARDADGEGAEPGAMDGSLGPLSPAELLELFHVNLQTGSLELLRGRGRGRQQGVISLRDGQVVHAAVGGVQGEKAFLRMLGWERGRFRFRPGAPPDETTIDRPTRALLREGVRQRAEWKRLAAELRPRGARARLRVSRASLPPVLHPLTQEVLLILEMTDSLDEVLDRCSFPDYQVLGTISTLVRRGLVDLRRGPAPGGKRRALAATAAARLRDRLLASGAPSEAAEAKVLVAACSDAALRAFCGLLERSGASLTSASPLPGIAPLGRLELDDDLGIEWLGASPDPRFAPAWPLAAHGALAVLLVHAGRPLESCEALRAAQTVFAQLPGTRLVHALIQDKGRPSASELCEALGILDDRSVATFRLDDAPSLGPALDALLARLAR
jgi:DNA-binding response OmpR family regulator